MVSENRLIGMASAFAVQSSLGMDPDLKPLRQVLLIPQVGTVPATHWYSGGGRGLFAEEISGRWCRIEYVFPVQGTLFELRWAENGRTRLWGMPRVSLGIQFPLHPPYEHEHAASFPADELQKLEFVMQRVPHSLWSRLIKLALDAHFIEGPFPQRAEEPRIERRKAVRA